MAFFSESLRNWTKKHDFIEGLAEWSPTEYAELTEFITEYSPTEYAECTEFTAEFFPTEYAELTEFTAEYSPTEYAECTKFTAEFFPTEYAELTEFTAEFSPTDFRCNFRGCTCLRSALPLARARSAPTKQTVMTSHRFHRSTQMVRVRIIKTTKYAHVKDGEVADSIAVEHNVLATFFPTLFHRRRTESDRTANANRSDGGRNPIGRRTESNRTETDWTANGI